MLTKEELKLLIKIVESQLFEYPLGESPKDEEDILVKLESMLKEENYHGKM